MLPVCIVLHPTLHPFQFTCSYQQLASFRCIAIKMSPKCLHILSCRVYRNRSARGREAHKIEPKGVQLEALKHLRRGPLGGKSSMLHYLK